MLTGLPAVVYVRPMPYRVIQVQGLVSEDGDRLLGQANPGNLEIRIDADQPPDGALLSLLHEILHLILEQAGHLDTAGDEGLIRALSCGLLNVFLDGDPLLAHVDIRQPRISDEWIDPLKDGD